MFDSLTTAALVDQFASEIEGGRVQQLGHLSRQAIWLEIYAHRRRRYLVASAENSTSAVYLTEEEPIWDREWVTPFLLLLRKYVRGSRLVGIQQPPLERVISLTFATPRSRPEITGEIAPPVAYPEGTEDDDDIEDDDDRVFTHLHLEIMGHRSNLILVDDGGLVMESVKRVTTSMSRVRPISPRIAFSPPPTPIKLDPRRATAQNIVEVRAQAKDQKSLIKSLTAAFRGLSPQIAAEAVFRAERDDQALAQSIRELYEPMLTGRWEPKIYLDSNAESVAYSAQSMSHLAVAHNEQSAPSISEAIQSVEVPQIGAGGTGRHAVRAQRLISSIDSSINRLRGRLDSLKTQETKHQNREQLREWGELIFGYLWQLTPGATELVVDGNRIPLDPNLDPREQARRYLDQYRDGKNADQHIETARAEIGQVLAFVEELRLLATQAEAIADLENLEAEWLAHGGRSDQPKRARRSSPPKRTTPVAEIEGNLIYVGRSSAENDRVTFDIAGPDDTWLHARGVPGSHVIVRWLGPRDDEATLARAAGLAGYFSQSRGSAHVEVDITLRRHVRKIKGGGPGMVTYRNERTVSVAPAE